MKPLLPSAVTRRQHTSPRGSHPVDFRPWRWFILSVLLLAAATLGGVFSGVAQAQDANGAINGLTLTSDSPGTLVVSWDTPSPAPSDYRVDWAKSSESYQSYKVDRRPRLPGKGPSPPPPSRTWRPVLSTRCACGRATTRVNTPTAHGAAPGRKQA